MANKWWTLIAVCTGVFMLLLDITIVNVALPDIQRDLDASLSDLQWVIDAYALTLAALQLTAGSLADRYGRKKLFAIGTVVFTIGSFLCGVAPTVGFLSAARSCSRPRWRCCPERSPAGSAAPRSPGSARRPGWPWRSARCSAACSP